MSLMQRISLIFRAKANKALDRAEDPRETLDYSYQRQLELLSKVRRGVADVATSRKRVELQVNQLDQQSAKLHDQAQKAISMGREDLAREALTRKSALASQIAVPIGMCTVIQATRQLQPGDIWFAIVLGHFTRCVLTVYRFRQGKWRTIVVAH